MKPIVEVLIFILQIYSYILIAMVVFSWLNAFGMINIRNSIVQTIGDFLYRLTEPVLQPIRRVVPVVSGLDLSAIVAFFVIYVLQRWLSGYIWHWVP